jgi:protein SCO1/2
MDRGDLTMNTRFLCALGIVALWAAGQSASIASGADRTGGVLINQYGEQMPASKLRGQYLLVYFGYTSCPDICPTALATMSRALDLLGPQRERVLPLFVTVDPGRDTVEVIRSYVAHFDRRLVGLTGSTEAIAAAREAFDVAAQSGPRDPNGNYVVDHSLFIYFAGPDGKVLQTFHSGQSAASIAGDARKFMLASRLAAEGGS